MARAVRGRLQALIGQLPDMTENDHLELFLQTNDGHHYTLDLPQRLADSFDASALSGQEVDVIVTDEPDNAGRLHLVQAPTLAASSSAHHRHRGLLQARTGSGTGPVGSIRIIVFIMDLSTLCGTAGPATTPQVQRLTPGE
jgi:hypothetical protein